MIGGMGPPGFPPGAMAGSAEEQKLRRLFRALDEEGRRTLKAIRRLAKTYPMIDRDRLFQQTSALMAQHVMQGRPAAEVIDELEALFAETYRKMLEGEE